MSEFMNIQSDGKNFHLRLLMTVSTLALIGATQGISQARADDDADRPVLWIELGGQLERTTGQGDVFTAPFLLATPTPNPFKPESPLHVEKPQLYSNGGEGKISFQPESSDWVFSAAVRYGRSNSDRHLHKQTPVTHLHEYFVTYYGSVHSYYFTASHAKFADTFAKSSASHIVLDFQAGKDVGLGMFGPNGSSTVSLGARFAQFSSKATVLISAAPKLNFVNFFGTYSHNYFPIPQEYLFKLTGESQRSFHALGPSISWNASADVAGNAQTSEVTLDWGINAAVLFGRQKTSVQHQTTGRYFCNFCNGGPHGSGYSVLYQNPPKSRNVTRSVTVPNVGGFAGVSFRYADAKISFGYRGDFFFGAIDGGTDTRKEQTLGFYGPFASISVGLGG